MMTSARALASMASGMCRSGDCERVGGGEVRGERLWVRVAEAADGRRGARGVARMMKAPTAMAAVAMAAERGGASGEGTRW